MSLLSNNKKTLRVLSQTYGKYRLHLVLLVIIGIVGALLDGIGINAIIPLFSFLLGEANASQNSISLAIKAVFDFIGVPFSFRFLIIFVAGMFLTRALFMAIFAYARSKISASFMYREMSDLLSSTIKAPWVFLSSQKTGYIQNTLFWDVRQMTNLLDVVAQFIQSFTGFAVYFFIALNISPTITLITILIGAVTLVFFQPLVKKTAELGERKSGLEKSFSNYLAEHVIGLKVIKSSGVGQKVTKIGVGLLGEFKTTYTRSAIVHTMGATLIQPLSLIFLVILFAFAYKLPGFDIAEFVVVLYLIQKIFVYLQSTQSSLHSIADHTPFAENVFNYKNLIKGYSDETEIGNKNYSFKNSLEIENVSFSYRPETPVLKSISLSIAKGEFIGLIGSSGGGKTSLVDILLRLIKPNGGQVSIDGMPVHEIKIEDWRTKVGYVSQDLFLINASVKENIRFYDDSISDGAIESAAKKAHIYNEIKSMPNGFDTKVEDRGVSLSVGQRQRIVFARAIARKPDILILDEPTSSLDSESEQAIKKTIEDIKHDVTLLVIAHRMSTITNADRVVVLHDGKIEDSASPKEMLRNPDSYMSRMLALQGLVH